MQRKKKKQQQNFLATAGKNIKKESFFSQPWKHVGIHISAQCSAWTVCLLELLECRQTAPIQYICLSHMLCCYFETKVSVDACYGADPKLRKASPCWRLHVFTYTLFPQSPQIPVLCSSFTQALNWSRMSLCLYFKCLLPLCGLGKEEALWLFWGTVANNSLQLEWHAGKGYPVLYLLLTSVWCRDIQGVTTRIGLQWGQPWQDFFQPEIWKACSSFKQKSPGRWPL